MTAPLDGIRVVEMTSVVLGPYACQMLGDLGADVIKIEPPKGDWMRRYALQDAYPGGVSVSFLAFNRNKRSICIDLRSEGGLAVARRIIDLDAYTEAVVRP